jgi:hypothetical protein
MLTLSGCGQAIDLSNVSQFAQTTVAASKSFDELSADWADSCSRLTEYKMIVQYARVIGTSPAPMQITQRPDISPTFVPHDQLPAVTPPTPMPLPSAPTAAAPAATTSPTPAPDGGPCATATANSKAWKAANDIVVGYVKALGSIAGADTKTYNYNFDKITGELKGLTTSQQQGISGLATTLADAYTAARARSDIAGFVLQADDALHYAVATLQNEISQGYLNELDFEKGWQANAFVAELSNQRGNVLSVSTVRTRWASRLVSLADKQQAVFAYREALQTILTTHEALKKAAQDKSLSKQLLANIAGGSASALIDDVSKIQQALRR